ncbi:hypothetical protein [Bradyrhizobium sp. ORS 86]|uniref:hypothetical protein n=1 Tax=Bradyrhizobium sp. ORS 86 TaxID=1685970 RepID=UPI00389048C7
MPDIDLVDWSVEEFRRLLDQPLDASDVVASQAALQMIMGDRSLSATAMSTDVTRGTTDAETPASTQETLVNDLAPGSQSRPASSNDARSQTMPRSDSSGWQTLLPRPDIDTEPDGAATPEFYALNAVRRFARRAVGALRSDGLDTIAESNRPRVSPNREQQSPRQTPSDTTQLATISSPTTETPPPPGRASDQEQSIRKAILVLNVQVTSSEPDNGTEPTNTSGATESILGQTENPVQLTSSFSEDAAQAAPPSALAEPSAPQAGADRDAAAIFDDSALVTLGGSGCEAGYGGMQPPPLGVSQAEFMAVTQTSETTDAGEPEALNSGGFEASTAVTHSVTTASTASQPPPNQDSTEDTLRDIDAQQMIAPLGRPYGLSRALSEADVIQPDPNQSGFGLGSNEDREPGPGLPDGAPSTTVAIGRIDEVDCAHEEPIEENALLAASDVTELVAAYTELPTEPTDQDLIPGERIREDSYLLPAPTPERSAIEAHARLESSSNAKEDPSATAHHALQTISVSQSVGVNGNRPVLALPGTSGQAAAGSATREFAVERGSLERQQTQPPLALPAASHQSLLRAVIQPDIWTALADRERAIVLRWALRDIRGMRLKMSPVGADTLQTLVDLSLVEMASGSPVLTPEGRAAIA